MTRGCAVCPYSSPILAIRLGVASPFRVLMGDGVKRYGTTVYKYCQASELVTLIDGCLVADLSTRATARDVCNFARETLAALGKS